MSLGSPIRIMSDSQRTETTYPSTSPTDESFRRDGPDRGQGSKNSFATMLSVNFDTPLAGEDRNKRIKEMSIEHPSVQGVQNVHNSVAKLQSAVRGLPNISSASADSICNQLSQVSCTVGAEFAQLLDAFMNLKLDAEDTGKAIPRMSIETSVASTKLDQVTQELKDARSLLDNEKQKRDEAETKIENMMAQLRLIFSGNLQKEVHDLKERVQHLQDQVNGKRHLWVLHRVHPQEEVTHALSVLISSVSNKDAVLKTLKEFCADRIADKAANNDNGNNSGSIVDTDASSSAMDTPNSTPLTTTFMPSRGPSAIDGLSGLSAIQAGPPRAPTSIPFSHRIASTGHWANNNAHGIQDYNNGKGSGNSGFSNVRPATSSQALIPSSLHKTGKGGASSRRGHQGYPGFQGHQGTSPFTTASYGSSAASSAAATAGSASINRPGTAIGPNTLSSSADWFMAPGSGSRSLQPYNSYNQQGGHNSRHMGSLSGVSRRTLASQTTCNTSTATSATDRENNDNVHDDISSQYSGSTFFSGNSSSAMVPSPPGLQTNPAMVQTWREELVNFYADAREFVSVFASEAVPAECLDQLRPKSIWAVLLRTYSPLSDREAVSYLRFHMTDGQYKSFVITRVIVDYMVHVVWKASIWKGCDPQSSQKLQDIEETMIATADQPAAARQRLLEVQADIIVAILARSGPSTATYRHKVEHITKLLMSSLEPILNTGVNGGEAYGRLEMVAARGLDLSARLMTSRFTFDFRFPEVGTRFSAHSMSPLWPSDVSATDLQARHWRIAMVMTPVVTCRNDTGRNISAYSVSNADVVCMQ